MTIEKDDKIEKISWNRAEPAYILKVPENFSTREVENNLSQKIVKFIPVSIPVNENSSNETSRILPKRCVRFKGGYSR